MWWCLFIVQSPHFNYFRIKVNLQLPKPWKGCQQCTRRIWKLKYFSEATKVYKIRHTHTKCSYKMFWMVGSTDNRLETRDYYLLLKPWWLLSFSNVQWKTKGKLCKNHVPFVIMIKQIIYNSVSWYSTNLFGHYWI